MEIKSSKRINGGSYSNNWTVLDEFAAKAMQGILAHDSEGIGSQMFSFSSRAEASYRMAEAMLAEREKRG